MRAHAARIGLIGALSLHALAHAEGGAPTEAAGAPALSSYLRAMGDAHLAPSAVGTVAELRVALVAAERAELEQRQDEASVLLLEALQSPRFAPFHDFDEYAAAEHRAGRVLLSLGSLSTARVFFERAIARGPKSPYYGPAVRGYTDVALRLGDLQSAADALGRYEAQMGEDTRGELDYLRARARYDAGDAQGAAAIFPRIGKRSRFYANAQYFLGAIAAHAKEYRRAEQRFCAVAQQGKKNHYDFFVDGRFFTVQDLARLALGRTAHEQRRGDDAFYYYFQVPNDSPRLAEALFEASYAAYEANDHDTALDLLDQLQTRFPESAFVDEAGILRGYVALARCDFERADRHFAEFARHFEPVLAEVDRLRKNALRRSDLYDELVASKQVSAGGESPRALPSELVRREVLALLRVDPEFYRLQASVQDLDAEAARSGRLADALSSMRVRLQSGERPRAAEAESAAGDPTREALLRDLSLVLAGARALADQVDALRASKANPTEVAALDRQVAELSQRAHALSERARLLPAPSAKPSEGSPQAGEGLAALLARDAHAARSFGQRSAELRARLSHAASARAERGLADLHDRLSGLLRRARIGRIDAVMGSKRRIERQIESLAAGRFPAELRDPLAVQGLLADDEAYWPFEGEDWPDEYEERYGSKADAAPDGAAR